MSKIRSIITILIVVLILIVVSTQTYAATTTEWIDEETGFKFNMITSSNGKVTARLVTGSGKYTTDTDEYLAAKQRANAKAAEMEKANASSSNGSNGQELKLETTQTEEKKTDVIKVAGKLASDVKDKGDLASTGRAFCIEQAGELAEVYNNNKISVAGNVINLDDVTQERNRLRMVKCTKKWYSYCVKSCSGQCSASICI